MFGAERWFSVLLASPAAVEAFRKCSLPSATYCWNYLAKHPFFSPIWNQTNLNMFGAERWFSVLLGAAVKTFFKCRYSVLPTAETICPTPISLHSIESWKKWSSVAAEYFFQCWIHYSDTNSYLQMFLINLLKHESNVSSSSFFFLKSYARGTIAHHTVEVAWQGICVLTHAMYQKHKCKS